MARVWIGTSGFSYKEWKGSFYPADLPDREMLSYYAKFEQFRTQGLAACLETSNPGSMRIENSLMNND